MFIKLKIGPNGMTYFPDELRDQGFTNEIEGIISTNILLLFKPGISIDGILDGIDLLKREVRLREKYPVNLPANGNKE